MYQRTLVLIPTYNEASNIKDLITTLYQLYPQLNIIIIDDCSPDATAEIVSTLQKDFPTLHLLKRQGPRGLGNAYKKGFEWGVEQNHFDYFIQMDADFSHDPSEIRQMLEQLETNQAYDIVLGSRYSNGFRVENWELWRICLSYFASIYVRLITSIPVKDPTSGFKAYRSKVINSLPVANLKSQGYIFQLELIYQAWSRGFQIYEHPILFSERRSGKSKINLKIILEAIFAVIILRFSKKENDEKKSLDYKV